MNRIIELQEAVQGGFEQPIFALQTQSLSTRLLTDKF